MVNSGASSHDAIKAANDAQILLAEQTGSGIVSGWPRHLVVEFTGACNLHCFMCGFEMLRDDVRSKGRTKFHMPVEMFRLVAKAAFPTARTVNPTLGGEPFLVPYWDEFLDSVAEYGCKVEMYTNGMLMRGDRLRKLMPHLAHLTVSIDGATKATFDHIRTGGKFEQVMANVAEFAGLRRQLGLRQQIRFAFNVVIMKENIDELPQIVELAADHDVDIVTGAFVIVTSDAVRNSSATADPVRVNRALAAARAVAARRGIATALPVELPAEGAAPALAPAVGSKVPPGTAPTPPALEVPEAAAPSTCESSCSSETSKATPSDAAATQESLPPPPGYAGKYYCDMAWRRVFVGLDGDVFPCCSPTRPILGNAFTQSFEEIWNGPEYRRLREGLYTGNLTSYCSGCPLLQEAGRLPYATTE